MNKDIEKTLNTIQTKLMTEDERERVWSLVETNYAKKRASPFTKIKQKTGMFKKLLVAVLIFSMTGATAYASNGAKPGDFLFPLDRGIESLQLAIASSEKQDHLRIEFAKERLQEIDEILGTSAVSATNTASTSTATTSTDQTGLTKAEADVFTNETVVTIELDGELSIFVSQATSSDAIISEIIDSYDVTQEEVEAVFALEIEDRASEPSDKEPEQDDEPNSDINDRDRERVAEAIVLAIELLDRVAAEDDEVNAALDELVEKINKNIDEVDRVRARTEEKRSSVRADIANEKARVWYKEDEDRRIKFEARSDNERARLEIKKDGRIKIKTEHRARADERRDDDDTDDQDEFEAEDRDDNNEDDNDDADDRGEGWGSEKVILCHGGEHTISISVAAQAAHLKHGDTLGRCGSDDDDNDDDQDDNDEDENDDDDTDDTSSLVISSVLASDVTDTTATVSWTTNEDTDSKVIYATSSDLSMNISVIEQNSSTTAHSIDMLGLLPETAYYYRVKSEDDSGNVATSSIGSFMTLATPDTVAPVLSSISATNTATTTAVITWTTNEPATSKVFYATSTPLVIGSAFVAESTGLVTSHSIELTSLSTSSTYYFVVTSADEEGNTATSTELSFDVQ